MSRSASSSSATRRSTGVVALRLGAPGSWSRNLPAAAAVSRASSVAAAAVVRAARSAAVRKTCGVCAPQSSLRSSVSLMTCVEFWSSGDRNSTRTFLTVSWTGAAAMMPSASGSAASSATKASRSAAVSSGRAASWIATYSVRTSASAFETLSARVDPPSTTTTSFRPCSWPAGTATTIADTTPQARQASSDQETIGRPPSGTKAFGPPAPSRSPEPAAAMTAVTCGLMASGGDSGGVPLLQQPVEVFLGAFLVFVEGVHELRGEDLLRPRVHLLLAGGEALFHLADGQVADHLGQLEHVAGLDLLAVVLETPVPVFRHLGDVVGEDGGDFFDFFLVDHAPQTGLTGVLRGDHHGELVVKDFDREVLTLAAHQLPRFLGHDQAGSVMG